jgi:hypothetical protein
MCQQCDTAQCKVIGNSNMTHTKCCYFNALLYLLSPFEQHVKVHILLSTTEIRIRRAVQPAHSSFWHYKLYGVQLHTPVLLSAVLIGKKALCSPVPFC